MNEDFEVKIEQDNFFPKLSHLKVTYNGYQWISFRIKSKEEAKIIVKKLKEYFKI